MVEVEKMFVSRSKNPYNIDTHQFYEVLSIFYIAHIMPWDKNGIVYYIYNYINWDQLDQLDQLYSSKWQNKRT